MRSDAFAAACSMPEGLKHHPNPANDKFDILDSEVAAWLIAQPEIREWVFEQFEMSGALIFDWATGTWSGNSAAVLFGDRRETRRKNTSRVDGRVPNDWNRVENEMRLKAFIARIPLPASVDYETLEHLIQRELDALGAGQFRLHCELAEMAIEILDEMGCHDVFVGTGINLMCPLAYRHASILCDKHNWAAETDEFTLHQALTSIISVCLKKIKASEQARMLLAGAMLEETEPHCGHWRGFQEKLGAAFGYYRAEEMITTARTELIEAYGRLEKEGRVIEEGEESFENIPKAGPHFE